MRQLMLDHPIVENLLRTGYPDGKEPNAPHCPICKQECEEIYRDRDNAIVGCDICLHPVDACYAADCFEEVYV